MVRGALYGGLFLALCMAYSCKTLFKMQLPPEVGDMFVADKLHPRLFHQTGTAVFEYRVIKDSVIYAGGADSTLTYGLIFPRARLTGVKTIQRRLFGSDSQYCRVEYNTHDIYVVSESRSALLDVVLPPEKYKRSYSTDEPPTITYYYRFITGICLYNNNMDTAGFRYETIPSKNGVDTALITGRIFYGNDSLVLKAYYLPVARNAEKQQYVYLLEGLGLYKQGKLLGFLQYAPQVEPGREKLYLSRHASAAEKLLIASYFTLFYDRL